jgi:sec-independent protein translocase protein TatA
MLNNIGTTEILIIALVLLVLFGAKKIPEFTRGLTQASREFRKGLKDEESGPKSAES